MSDYRVVCFAELPDGVTYFVDNVEEPPTECPNCSSTDIYVKEEL